MVAVLRDQHVRQQSWPRRAALDGTARRLGLHNAVALRAAQLHTHITDHYETGWHVLQHLRNILAQLAQLALALWTHGCFGIVPLRLSRKMIRQSPARGLHRGRTPRGWHRSRFRRLGLFLAAIRL